MLKGLHPGLPPTAKAKLDPNVRCIQDEVFSLLPPANTLVEGPRAIEEIIS